MIRVLYEDLKSFRNDDVACEMSNYIEDNKYDIYKYMLN